MDQTPYDGRIDSEAAARVIGTEENIEHRKEARYMDLDQVQARIIEVGQLVKQKLIEKEKEQRIQYGDDIEKRAGLWYKERGYKYIDDVDYHLRRFFQCLDLLAPRHGGSVFEIGSGNCFFLFMCRELRGCRVAAVDWKRDEDDLTGNKDPEKKLYRDLKKYAYHLFREYFGLQDVIKHQIVHGNKPIEFGGEYDYIVATRATFNRHWREKEYRFWLDDCYRHLRPGGNLMIALNKVEPKSLAALPFLRPLHPSRENEKISIISRETIREAIMERC